MIRKTCYDLTSPNSTDTVILAVRALTDNYCYILHRRGSKDAIAIDPSEAAPIQATLSEQSLRLRWILNTHHHFDHVGGNRDLVESFAAEVMCSKVDLARIPCAGRGLGQDEMLALDELKLKILEIPGHTKGQIAFYSHLADALFAGDTLFSLGCGGLKEGTIEELYSSVGELSRLPGTTRLFFGHEYTEKNSAFALTIDPGNQEIIQRRDLARAALARNEIPAPPLLSEEKKVNPFFRLSDPTIRANLNLSKASDLQVFTELRHRRDVF
jgi:hydroxyacylglutathione hydrolase